MDESAKTVTHSVLGSWHPNWVGTDQVRHLSFDSDKLVIETPPISSSRPLVSNPLGLET